MGTDNSSLSSLQSYCSEVQFALDEEQLMSDGYNLIETFNSKDNIIKGTEHTSKKSYYECSYKRQMYVLQDTLIHCKDLIQSHNISKTLERLKYNRFNHIERVISYQIPKPQSFHQLRFAKKSIEKTLKIFYTLNENKFLNSLSGDTGKGSLKDMRRFMHLSDLQICDLMKKFCNFFEEVRQIDPKINQLDPNNFYKTQNGESFKYVFRSSDWAGPNLYNTCHYISPEHFQNPSSGYINNKSQEKGLVFVLGLITLHYIIEQECSNCYNWRENQFCWSQIQAKLDLLYKVLLRRNAKKTHQLEEYKYFAGCNNEADIQNYSNKWNCSLSSLIDPQQHNFEKILYEIVCEMLKPETTRKSFEEIKKQINFLSLHLGQSLIENNKTVVQQGISDSQHNDCDQNTTDKSFPIFKSRKIKGKKAKVNEQESQKQFSAILTDKKYEKALILDKENQINLSNQTIANFKKKIEKKSTVFKEIYQEIYTVQFQDNSILEGYFLQDRAHGLGTILKANGQVEQCIYNEDSLIQEIRPILQ